ncbi:MAG: hypothetical protein IT372_00075 [Polyangiaceae bacterium]|nr:hypothetical protein [Polyangiaceae bacterium]
MEQKVSGWKEICAAVGLEPNQWRRLREAARRAVNPLPIYYDPFGKPTADPLALLEWVRAHTLPLAQHELQKAGIRGRRRAAA